MADLDPPTLGEVLRGLDALRGDVAGLVAELKADREQIARVYLRSDLYTAERNAQNAIVADLHGDVGKAKAEFRNEVAAVRADYDNRFKTMDVERKGDLAWRRQVFMWGGGLALTTMGTVAGLILQYTSTR